MSHKYKNIYKVLLKFSHKKTKENGGYTQYGEKKAHAHEHTHTILSTYAMYTIFNGWVE
jgi:hypothetical protein